MKNINCSGVIYRLQNDIKMLSGNDSNYTLQYDAILQYIDYSKCYRMLNVFRAALLNMWRYKL